MKDDRISDTNREQLVLEKFLFEIITFSTAHDISNADENSEEVYAAATIPLCDMDIGYNTE